MIALFDSGIGGLTVLSALWRHLPTRDYLYLSDQAHFPYGDRAVDEIRGDVARFAALARREGAKALVLACNTASALALDVAQDVFGQAAYGVIAPVGVAAAQRTRRGKVGVLATTNTCLTHAYRDAVPARVEEVACPELIALAEVGGASDAEVEREAEVPLATLRQRGCDVIILGCTHLPHFERVLRGLAAPWAIMLDPGEALAAELAQRLPPRVERGRVRCRTTGDPEAFRARLEAELPQIAARSVVTALPAAALIADDAAGFVDGAQGG